MFILGITEFIRNIKRHIISIFLIVIVLLSANVISALLKYEFDKLSVVAPYMNQKGLFREVYDPMLVKNGMDSNLEGIKEMFCVSYLPGVIDYIDKNHKTVSETGMIYMYDDLTVQKFEPLLQEGVWLDAVEKQGDLIPCIISKNEMGYEVGSVIEFSEIGIKLLVVGILQDGAEILGGELNYSITDQDYRVFFQAVSYDLTNSHYILTRASDFDEHVDEMTGFMSEALFVYDDGIGEETEKQNILNANETGIGMSMEEFRENSMEYFKNEIGTYVPMCLSVFISILITIMVLAALNYRKGLDVMGIYFACGMSPKKALVLNAVSTACTCVVSVLASILIMELFHLELGNKIFLRMGALQIWVDAGLILIIAFANIFVPVWNMYKLSPAESIRKRGMMA